MPQPFDSEFFSARVPSATVILMPSQERLIDAPTGAKFAVLEGPRGTEIVDLSVVGSRGSIKGEQAPAAGTNIGPCGRNG